MIRPKSIEAIGLARVLLLNPKVPHLGHSSFRA